MITIYSWFIAELVFVCLSDQTLIQFDIFFKALILVKEFFSSDPTTIGR